MRKLAAHFILTPDFKVIRNAILELGPDNTILNLRTSDNFKEEDHLEFYNGILCPGMVNVHTHLELSHLKGQIPEQTGISGFVDQVVKLRSLEAPQQALLKKELDLMFLSGIQAIGDIVNTADTLEVKARSKIRTHSFVELFGLLPEKASAIWGKGLLLKKQFQDLGLSASLTPHAPYSVSENLWEKFKTVSNKETDLLSIHHMESLEENQLFISQSGPLAERFKKMGLPQSDFPGLASSSSDWLSSHLPIQHRILLIHNTFSQLEEIVALMEKHPNQKFFFGLCPNANLYIENSLPKALIENRHKLNLCLGTDSLASNHQLSIWEEIKTLKKSFPYIQLEELLKMACLNGAEALGMENEIGSFKIGNKPGVVLIEGIDLKDFNKLGNSRIRRII